MKMSKRRGVDVAAFDDDDFTNPSLLEDAFQRVIEHSKHGELLVDLSHVYSLTSLGIAVLVAAQGIALIYETTLAYVGIQPRVRKLLAQVGVVDALPLYDTVDEALEALRDAVKRSAAHLR